MHEHPWTPDRKITAAAIAAILVWIAQAAAGLDVPPGVESAVAVLVAYLVPAGGQDDGA